MECIKVLIYGFKRGNIQSEKEIGKQIEVRFYHFRLLYSCFYCI